MSLTLHTITFDAADPAALATFWSKALDRPVAEGATDFYAQLEPAEGSPSMFFLKVPEDKSAKNRMHVDLVAADREAEIERLVGLGATRHDDHDEWGARWTVMADVEGNEFCIAAQSAS
jgi:hypothetical protein